MKQMLTATLVLMSTLTHANEGHKIMNSAEEYINKSFECRRLPSKCSGEKHMGLLSEEGKISSRYELQDALNKSHGKSFFVPLSLSNTELLTLAATTSLGVVAFANDQEIMDVVQDNKSETTKRISQVGDLLGESGIGVAAGSYFLGVVYKNDKLKNVGLFIVGSSVASSIVAEAVKNTFNRVRPTNGDGPHEFFKAGNDSFYSGHTTQAFSLATVISEMYKEDYPMVPYVAYGLASLTAYGRVHNKKHWASDVLVGAVAGHLVTKLAMSAMDGNTDGRGGLIVYPEFDRKKGKVTMNLEYTPRYEAPEMKCKKIKNPIHRVDACLSEALK